MSRSSRSFALSDLSWVEVRAHLAHDRRLIVPVGACDQFGPHLPIGAGTLVAEAIADTLARDFGVLRAPTIAYGVNVPGEAPLPGPATLHEKTLHRLLNDLLASWEDHGFQEFILISVHGYEPHLEALATTTLSRARIRVIDVLGVDLAAFLDAEASPQHGGEALTSLLLHLHPERVRLELAEDFYPPSLRSGPTPTRRLGRLPAGSPGSLGFPSRASAEKGERIFEYIVQKIRAKVFLAPEEDA